MATYELTKEQKIKERKEKERKEYDEMLKRGMSSSSAIGELDRRRSLKPNQAPRAQKPQVSGVKKLILSAQKALKSKKLKKGIKTIGKKAQYVRERVKEPEFTFNSGGSDGGLSFGSGGAKKKKGNNPWEI